MKKILKWILYVIIGIALLFAGAHFYLKHKITQFLDGDIAENIRLDYSDFSLNTLTGSISISDVRLKQLSESDSVKLGVSSNKIAVNDVSYWEYIANGEIHISSIFIENNQLNLYKTQNKEQDSASAKKSKNFDKNIFIDSLFIGPTELNQFTTPSHTAPEAHAVLSKIALSTIKFPVKDPVKKIPFNYKSIVIAADTAFYKLSRFNELKTGAVTLTNNDLNIENFELATPMSRQNLSQESEKERDHVQLNIPIISLQNMDWGFSEDNFQLKIPRLTITEPHCSIYRDKRLDDNTSKKQLYSESLRNLPLGLQIDSMLIKKGHLVYSEKTESQEPAGTLYFENLNAEMTHIVAGHLTDGTDTKINISTQFMKTAPATVDWSFNVQNPKDRFVFKTSVDNFDASQINDFTVHTVGLSLEGEINQIYFTISGDDNSSQTDIRLKYEDFKVEMLNDKSKNKWFISTIANIFVKKNSKKNGNLEFQKGSATTQRDKQKSFFNFIWISLKDALIKAIT
ncbi:MAG: hypothetical protein WBG71_00110 [Leeuwenhoekiella sp.]